MSTNTDPSPAGRVARLGLRSNQPQPLLLYAQMVWRRRVLVLLVALGMAAPAGLVSSLQTSLYESSAQLLVTQRTVDANYNVGDQSLTDLQVNTQLAVLSGVAVSRRAAELGATVPVRGAGTSNSNVVTITARAPDPAVAVASVRATIQAYTEIRISQGRNFQDIAAERLRGQLASLQQQLETVSPDLLGIQASIQQEQLRVQEQLGRLDIQRSLTPSGAVIIREASTPSAPASPQPLRDALLALVLGLGLGLSLAVVLETVRRRSPDSVPVEDEGRRSPSPSSPRAATTPAAGTTVPVATRIPSGAAVPQSVGPSPRPHPLPSGDFPANGRP